MNTEQPGAERKAKPGIGELQRAILEAIDLRGYLPTWGWNRMVPESKEYTRKQRSRAMSLLIEDGVVETREAVFNDTSRDVFVRSQRYSERILPLNKEMGMYRSQHPWWVPTGTIIIPESYLSKRKQRGGPSAARAGQMYHAVGQRPFHIGGSEPENGAFVGDAGYPTLRDEESEMEVPEGLLEEISDLMKISHAEAEIFVLDLAKGYTRAKNRRITAEMAATQYLRHKHDDYCLWD